MEFYNLKKKRKRKVTWIHISGANFSLLENNVYAVEYSDISADPHPAHCLLGVDINSLLYI